MASHLIKYPTEISYEVPNAAPEQVENGNVRPQIRWGFQFKPEESRLRCVKLFLDRNQKLPHFVSPLETAAQLRKCNRTVMDAVSDYLTKIYEHTMEDADEAVRRELYRFDRSRLCLDGTSGVERRSEERDFAGSRKSRYGKQT